MLNDNGALYAVASDGVTGYRTAIEDHAHRIAGIVVGSGIDYTTVHMRGTLAARPTAATGNAGRLYLATDDNGGKQYRSTGIAWEATAKGVTEAPQAHHVSHEPGSADALDYTAIHKVGTLAARPAAAAANNGLTYLATDDNGGTTYRSNGSSWALAGAAVNSTTTPAAAYRTLQRIAFVLPSGTSLATPNFVKGDGTLAASGVTIAAGAGIDWHQLVAAEQAITGRTTKLDIRLTLGDGPASTATVSVGLYPLTFGAGNVTVTAGAVVSGSTVTVTPTANSPATNTSGDITPPSDGPVALLFTTSGTSNQVGLVTAQLRVHNV